MLPLLSVYLVFLTLNCVNSWVLVCGKGGAVSAAVSLWIGSVCFLISDNILGRSVFGKWVIWDSHKINSVVIMVSYYLAQLLMFEGGHNLVANSGELTQNQSLIS